MKTIYLLCLAIFITTSMAWAEEESPVAHWKFDEGKGNILHNSSGNENNGKIHKTRWVTREGRTALRFNGGHVTCGNTRHLKLRNQISVSAWLWPEQDNPKKDAIIVGYDPDTWALTRYKNYIYFYVSGGGNYVKTVVAGNQWSHIVGTFDGTLLKIYVNGALKASRKPKTLKGVTAGKEFFIGAGHKTRERYRGLASDVRVYNRTLGPQEVSILSQPPVSELVQMKLTDTQKAGATAFFKKPRKNVEFTKSGQQLWLANDKIGVEILQGKHGFYLSRIYGVKTSQDFVWSNPSMMSARVLAADITA